MKIPRISWTLVWGLFCFCAYTLSQEQNMTVTGVLTHRMAIGGESTGWQIELDSQTSIDGKPARVVEVDFRDKKKLEQLNNKRVRVAGKISRRTGVETGVRPVLEISSLEEAATPSNSDRYLAQLLGRIWQVTDAPSKSASGSIYIFLPNGTLLQTSCVETYRVARWSADKGDSSLLRVVEEGQVAFTASITEISDKTLKLRKELTHGSEVQEISLKAVEREFICPDLPK